MNKVVIPYDPLWEPLKWAKKHCGSEYITNTVHHEDGLDYIIDGTYRIDYFFTTERAAAMFALKWT